MRSQNSPSGPRTLSLEVPQSRQRAGRGPPNGYDGPQVDKGRLPERVSSPRAGAELALSAQGETVSS